jgi:hypothetical protein
MNRFYHRLLDRSMLRLARIAKLSTDGLLLLQVNIVSNMTLWILATCGALHLT